MKNHMTKATSIPSRAEVNHELRGIGMEHVLVARTMFHHSQASLDIYMYMHMWYTTLYMVTSKLMYMYMYVYVCIHVYMYTCQQ